MLPLLRELSVSRVPDSALRGSGLRHVYEVVLEPFEPGLEPLVACFLDLVRRLLDAWNHEASEEWRATVAGVAANAAGRSADMKLSHWKTILLTYRHVDDLLDAELPPLDASRERLSPETLDALARRLQAEIEGLRAALSGSCAPRTWSRPSSPSPSSWTRRRCGGWTTRTRRIGRRCS